MPTLYGRSGAAYRVEDEPFNTSGGQSELFRCRDRRDRVRVYKRYRSPVTDPDPIDWLRAVTDRGRAIVAAAERKRRENETAESSINWPIDIVFDKGAVAGVVLPLIPSSFLRIGGKAQTFDYLCLASAAPPPAAVRVGVLIRICDIFAALERAGLIHGDISQKNIVWRQHRTHAYLIDCDGIRPRNSTARRGVGTEGWKDPRWVAGKIPAHDQYSDRFGLAVLMYRGLLLNPGAPALVAGQWHRPSGLPADLDPRLRALFERAFDEPYQTDQRPTAQEWRAGLIAVFLTPDRTGFQRTPLRVLARHADQFRPAPVTPQRTASIDSRAGRTPHTPGPPLVTGTANPSRRRGVTLAAVAGVVVGLLAVSAIVDSADDAKTRSPKPTAITVGPYDPLPPGSHPKCSSRFHAPRHRFRPRRFRWAPASWSPQPEPSPPAATANRQVSPMWSPPDCPIPPPARPVSTPSRTPAPGIASAYNRICCRTSATAIHPMGGSHPPPVINQPPPV
ncbi:hypothetical protein [Nocardia crassostreae]|uniref:hypothetical protein n=1 Tax=Nocardia crassostreae TaxID=53428 RepID=UPI00082B8F86|nr:hypothetical protein [Nocardia crassostreae]